MMTIKQAPPMMRAGCRQAGVPRAGGIPQTGWGRHEAPAGGKAGWLIGCLWLCLAAMLRPPLSGGIREEGPLDPWRCRRIPGWITEGERIRRDRRLSAVALTVLCALDGVGRSLELRRPDDPSDRLNSMLHHAIQPC